MPSARLMISMRRGGTPSWRIRSCEEKSSALISKAASGAPNAASAARVVGVGVNQHVEILRGARVPVEGDGGAPDDDEARLRFVQLHEDVAEIVEEFDHRLEALSHRRERGTNRT
jgi:hypothetical protein